jgi:GT2 family glycosyltransferase
LDRVFAIIVTYNGMDWIQKCIDSLLLSLNPSAIVVVDNFSTDHTVSFIQVNYPCIRLICLGRNLGFGQANNIGIELAREHGAQYYFLLNQDAWVERDTIGKLINLMKENRKVGVLSPLHLNGSGTDLDLYFKKYLQQSSLGSFLKNTLVCKEPGKGLIRTRFVNAAAWMISVECLDKTGGFDPVFFHYGEDENYAQRVWKHGYEMAIHCDSRIYHDREQRIVAATREIVDYSKEWIHFLVYSCDINKRGYILFMIKRFLKAFIQVFIHLIFLDIKKLGLDLYMLCRIPFSFLKVRESRARSLRGHWDKIFDENKNFIIHPAVPELITPN